MAVGSLITQDYNIEVNETLLLGPGTPYDIINIEGLDLPGIRTGDVAKTLANGYWSGSDLLEGRTITIEMTVSSSDDTTQATNLDALISAFGPTGSERSVVFKLPGFVSRFANCRVRKMAVPVNWDYHYRLPKVTVELFASDPLLYATSLGGGSVGLRDTGGGASANFTFDMTFGAPVSGGRLIVSNDGTYATTPSITLYGPLLAPKITKLSTGEYISLYVTVDAGSAVELDFRYHTVNLDGVSRYDTLDPTSTWFSLDPGDTEIQFTHVDVYNATAQMNLTYRSAWV